MKKRAISQSQTEVQPCFQVKKSNHFPWWRRHDTRNILCYLITVLVDVGNIVFPQLEILENTHTGCERDNETSKKDHEILM